jgi:hypothetical protein
LILKVNLQNKGKIIVKIIGKNILDEASCLDVKNVVIDIIE